MSRHYFTQNNDLKSKRKEISFRFSNNELIFISDNGVFAKDGIDYGSRLLLETFLNQDKKHKILDVGCGYGFLGISIAKLWGSNVDMIDVNDRAITLTQANSLKNKVNINVWISDLFRNVENTYDVIITNPPIRAGKQVIYQLFKDAYNHLDMNGELWIVIRKQHGAESAKRFLETIYAQVDIVTKAKGFWILKAIK